MQYPKYKGHCCGIVVEGPVLVNMYRPTGQRTFKEYFEERLEPFLQEKLVHVYRFNVVWDIYLANRLKMTIVRNVAMA